MAILCEQSLGLNELPFLCIAQNFDWFASSNFASCIIASTAWHFKWRSMSANLPGVGSKEWGFDTRSELSIKINFCMVKCFRKL